MTPEERADAIVTVEHSDGGNYHDLFLGGLRLQTFYAGTGDPQGEKARERSLAHRAALARAIASAIKEAVAAEREECASACMANPDVVGFTLAHVLRARGEAR